MLYSVSYFQVRIEARNTIAVGFKSSFNTHPSDIYHLSSIIGTSTGGRLDIKHKPIWF